MIDLAEAIRDAHGVADIAALDRARGQLADLLLCLETRRCGPGAVKVCPICRASLNGAATCRRCRADLAMVQAVERRGRTLTGAACSHWSGGMAKAPRLAKSPMSARIAAASCPDVSNSRRSKLEET